MVLRLACAVAFGAAISCPAQSMRMTAVVDRDWFVEVEHGALGALERTELPRSTDLGVASVHAIQAASGRCLANSQVVINGIPSSLMLQASVNCSLLGRQNGEPARGRSGGDLLLTLTAPTATAGTLLVGIDTRGSFGIETLGEMFVDIGDDGVGEYGHGGQNPAYVTREFPCVARPEGTRVRICHIGIATADNTRDARYFANLTLRFLPWATPIVPYQEGCQPLHFGRTMTGVMFDFGGNGIPPNSLFFLAVGTPGPVLPQPVLGRQIACNPVLDVAAVQMLTTPRAQYPRPFLPLPGTVIVQGFVFGPGGMVGTDSWRLY